MTPVVRDTRGVAATEFALLAPVLLLLLMGLFDLCYRSYAQAMLTGAVQAAARKAGLEGNASTTATAALDDAVVSQMRVIAPGLRWVSSRKSYHKFGDVAAEPFDDTNKNKRYDVGECYTDINDNKQWDADPGATGQGGASDITIYTMQITYPRLFPLAGLMGLPSEDTVTAKTTLKNQPYDSPATATPATICT